MICFSLARQHTNAGVHLKAISLVIGNWSVFLPPGHPCHILDNSKHLTDLLFLCCKGSILCTQRQKCVPLTDGAPFAAVTANDAWHPNLVSQGIQTDITQLSLFTSPIEGHRARQDSLANPRETASRWHLAVASLFDTMTAVHQVGWCSVSEDHR